jgi:hypothetical protein
LSEEGAHPPTGARRPVAEDIPGLMDEVSNGKSLHAACRERGIHSGHTLAFIRADDRHWANYARARTIRGDTQGHRVSEIVDDVIAGKIEPDVARAAIDGLKWTAGRMAPKLWGDRQQIEHVGEGGGPIQYASLTPEERKARIAQLQEKQRVPDDGGGD